MENSGSAGSTRYAGGSVIGFLVAFGVGAGVSMKGGVIPPWFEATATQLMKEQITQHNPRYN